MSVYVPQADQSSTVPGPPVINHASLPPHKPSPPPSQAQSSPKVNPPPASSVNAPNSTMTSRPPVRDVPPPPAAGQNSSQQPKKSPFEFVSPFEVFQSIPQQASNPAPQSKTLRSPNGSPRPEQNDRRPHVGGVTRERKSSALPAGSPHRAPKTQSSPAPDVESAAPPAQPRPTPHPEYDVAKLTSGLAGRGQVFHLAP